MHNHKDIVEKLSLFNNVSLTKRQWETVLKGCGCPKSAHLWSALRENNLQKNKLMYTLVDINEKTFSAIYNKYCIKNRESVRKTYNKTKAKIKAKESINKNRTTIYYVVNGVVTTEKPIKE